MRSESFQEEPPPLRMSHLSDFPLLQAFRSVNPWCNQLDSRAAKQCRTTKGYLDLSCSPAALFSVDRARVCLDS